VVAGRQIHDERRRRRWSLQALADRAGMSDAHVAQVEAGKVASVETYVRLMTALDLEPQLIGADRSRREARTRDQDLVHSAMGEIEASRLSGFGLGVGIDEPYQHYQFAGRADVVAWDLAARALLHIENRTRFPNVQEALGSYAAKRAYLGRVLAERFGLPAGWKSETHVIAALWTSEVIHVLRRHQATFRAACPDGSARFRDWWSGRIPEASGSASGSTSSSTSSLVLFDPAPGVRAAYRFAELADTTRPRYRGYAEAASALGAG
jgi:transcriptional regulator with XRE-family HTH domain